MTSHLPSLASIRAVFCERRRKLVYVLGASNRSNGRGANVYYDPFHEFKVPGISIPNFDTVFVSQI
jgi:hypothetical protein